MRYVQFKVRDCMRKLQFKVYDCMKKVRFKIRLHEKFVVRSTIWRCRVRLQIMLQTVHFSCSCIWNCTFFMQSRTLNRNLLMLSHTSTAHFSCNTLLASKSCKIKFFTHFYTHTKKYILVKIFYAHFKSIMKSKSIWEMIPLRLL